MFQLDPLLAVAVLAGLHIWCGRWRFIRSDRHSNWLSFSGGAAVAYVFMGLLPKLSLWQAEVLARRQAEPAVPRICEALGIVQWCGGLKNFLIYDIFLSALAGLVFFYWVDWLVQHKRPPGGPGESQGRRGGRERARPPTAFFSYISAYLPPTTFSSVTSSYIMCFPENWS